MDAVKLVKCVEGNYETEDTLVDGCIYQVWKEDRDYYYVNPVNPAAGWDKDRFEEFHFNVEATPEGPEGSLGNLQEGHREADEEGGETMEPEMKVICVDNTGLIETTVTVGKVYIVEQAPPDYYLITDDQGDQVELLQSRFEPFVEPSYLPDSMKLNGSAKDTQVGGAHYTKLKIQPYEYCTANNIPYVESNAIKYLTRWRDKGGIEDLKKAVHSIQWLIEYTEKSG
jgi:hypothetical protein